MLHYIVIVGLTLLVVGCVIVLFRIRPEDTPPKLPQDLRHDPNDRTHFYEVMQPGRGLPPVPPVKRAKHAEPTTDVIPMQGFPATRAIPKVGYQR